MGPPFFNGPWPHQGLPFWFPKEHSPKWQTVQNLNMVFHVCFEKNRFDIKWRGPWASLTLGLDCGIVGAVSTHMPLISAVKTFPSCSVLSYLFFQELIRFTCIIFIIGTVACGWYQPTFGLPFTRIGWYPFSRVWISTLQLPILCIMGVFVVVLSSRPTGSLGSWLLVPPLSHILCYLDDLCLGHHHVPGQYLWIQFIPPELFLDGGSGTIPNLRT